MGANQCEVKAKLHDGEVTLRLDFNALEYIQARLGVSIAEFFAQLGKKDGKAAERLLDAAFLRSVFYAGMLWTVPVGEEPSFDERSVGRRMDVSKLAEYGEVVVELFLSSFGLKPHQGETRKRLESSRKTRRASTSKRKRKNPT